VSTRRDTSQVTSQHPDTPPLTAADPPVVIYVALFVDRPNVRRAEDLLAQLWVDGQLEVFDGTLLDWPVGSPHPLRRPLQSLPRLAALPEPVWAACQGHLQSPSHTHDLLPPLPGALASGRSAIIAFCATTAPERVKTDLEATGAAVATALISTHHYSRLRQPSLPNSSRH
jgi:hypothetical protein